MNFPAENTYLTSSYNKTDKETISTNTENNNNNYTIYEVKQYEMIKDEMKIKTGNIKYICDILLDKN